MSALKSESDPHVTEAVANAVTHGLGLAASLVAFPILLLDAMRSEDSIRLTGAAVYGLSLVVLFATSTAYHSFARSPARNLLRTIDHSAIYILIAGSYTPFAVGPLRGAFGYSVLAAVWIMALAGIVMKLWKGFGRGWRAVVPYIAMGWLAVIGLKPLFDGIGARGIMWMLAGGLFYTGGVYFYAFDKRIRYGHAVWHLFVLGGAVCHFFAVLWHT
jgi:hemolysin III